MRIAPTILHLTSRKLVAALYVALATLALSTTVRAAPEGAPVANVTATDDMVYYSGDTSAVFTISLSQSPVSKLTVNYKLKGTAANGVDYVMLSDKVKFKPGKTSKSVTIVPKGDLRGASSRTVKLVLETAEGYTVGDASDAKVKIIHAKLIVLP